MARILIVLLFIPLFAFAQESDLRAQIRADLLKDPRTAQMSSAELDALVSALAAEAEATGADTAYLDAQGAPVFSYDPPPAGQNQWVSIFTAPIVLAGIALLAALIGITIFLRHSRRKDIVSSGA